MWGNCINWNCDFILFYCTDKACLVRTIKYAQIPYLSKMKLPPLGKYFSASYHQGKKIAKSAGEIGTKHAMSLHNAVPTKKQTRDFAVKTKRSIDSTLKGVNTEAAETKVMAQSFFQLLESKLDLTNRKEPPTEEEVKKAIEQLKDVGRISVFATISIIPGGGFSLIGLELLARKYGVKNFTIVPSSFRTKKNKDFNTGLDIVIPKD